MTRNESEAYPLKSLHDFLNELNIEWEKFRRAALIGMITSGVLFIFLLLRILSIVASLRRSGVGLFSILYDVLFFILIAVFVIYEIILLLDQHKFFKKWERRVGLLLHLEESIMEKRFENISKENDKDKR